MRQKLIVLAAISASGIASAQSSVTLFGVVDAGYETIKTASGRMSGLAPSMGAFGSRIGFRGTEDLGGGLSAGFWLESALNPANGSGSSGTSTNNEAGGVGKGSLTFNRRSTVMLSGGFGQIRIGRDYVPTYRNRSDFDPSGNNGVGAFVESYEADGESAAFIRASNSIAYFLPGNLGGFYGQVMYAFGNRPSNQTFAGAAPAYAVGQSTRDNGRYMGLRVGYAQGPVDTAIAYGHVTYAPGTNTASVLGLADIPTGNVSDLNWAGSYQIGPVKAMGLVSRQTMSDAGAPGNEARTTGWGVGADWRIGAEDLWLSYSRVSLSSPLLSTEPRAAKWAIGYVHNFSKRTVAYATYARVSNSGGAAEAASSFSSGGFGGVAGPANVNGSSSGFDLGLRHSF